MIESTSRRRFLTTATAAVTATAATAVLAPAALARSRLTNERHIAFHHAHTGERFSGPFWADGAYDPDALARIDRLLRDFRTGEVYEIDRRLLDLLAALRGRLATRADFRVISGYRSPRTNAMLVKNGGGGVAKRSYHMRGMAIDVAVPGRAPEAVYEAARELQRGGAGLYRKSGFVHVDVGPVRFW